MIRRIRKQHKLVWLLLAVILSLLFIAGIAFRHRAPINEKVPNRLTTETQRARSFKVFFENSVFSVSLW